MMGVFLKTATAIVAGIVLGLAVTWLTIVRGAGLGADVRDGPWRTSLLVGSAKGGMALRAAVALHGLFALNRSEAIYYTAATDSEGAPLDGRCAYRISGGDLPARWWSITAYGADDFLVPNRQHRYSVTKNAVLASGGGHFDAAVRRDAAGPREIAAPEGRFSLTLRLYNPDPAVAADPAHVALPAIAKGRCA